MIGDISITEGVDAGGGYLAVGEVGLDDANNVIVVVGECELCGAGETVEVGGSSAL